MLIAEEVNAVETAYLRLHLVSDEARPALQESFRQYVDSRLAIYRKLPDIDAAGPEATRAKKLQEEVWNAAVSATRLPSSHPAAGLLLLPALNTMIDIATTRTMALQSHPPGVVYALLFGLGLICSLLAGYRMAIGPQRSWVHILGFTVITVVIVYVTLDMEYPRTGLIQLQTADQLLLDARERMK
jgi:multidrug transporter EmrE-like cation transporter